jgi:hypothetical protein
VSENAWNISRERAVSGDRASVGLAVHLKENPTGVGPRGVMPASPEGKWPCPQKLEVSRIGGGHDTGPPNFMQYVSYNKLTS